MKEVDHRSNVDSSRPFRSVKEAVAIFGEKILVGEVYSPKPFSFTNKEAPYFSPKVETERDLKHGASSSSPRGSGERQDAEIGDTVKKLEMELEETKKELKLLKEREAETEVAVASLNAELHKSMSKVARAEAVEAARAAAEGEKDKRMGLVIGPSLGQVLSVGEKESLFVGRKKGRKKKPIIPLVGDFFSRKKGASSTLQNPLYASSSSSHFHYNLIDA